MSIKLKDTANITATSASSATSATKLQTARSINGTNFDGTGNITTANWGSARTLTIGNTGKSVNGSGNVSWSLSEIGAAPAGYGLGTTCQDKSNQDCNNILVTGFYRGSNMTNKPSGCTQGWIYLLVMSHDNSSWVRQVAYDFGTASQVYTRVKQNGSWTSWVATDNNTWRGVQDNLTSTATDQSLSANQGKVLKGLIDGKAASNHTHSYVPLANGGNITIHADSDSSSTGEYALIKAGHNELKIASSAGGTTVTKGQDKLTFNGNIVYHAGRKPTISEIGAAAASHTHNYAASPSAGGSASTVYLPRTTGASVSANYLPGANRFEFKEFANDCKNTPNANWYHIFTGQGSDANYNTQLALGMTTQAVYYRNRSGGTWGGWKQLAFTDSSISGNASTATTLQTARTIGKASFNGSANITLAQIMGYATTASSGNATYVNQWTRFATIDVSSGAWTECSGSFIFSSREADAFSGTLQFYFRNGNTVESTSISLRWTELTNSSYANCVAAVKVSNGKYDLYFKPIANYTMMSITALVQQVGHLTLHSNQSYSSSITAAATSSLSACANTANTLATARTINGTSFNGGANITTANWGTARNIQIGNTAKSVNGSANVSWSLSEIGAAASNHTHSYLPLSGGTLTSSIKFSGGGYNNHAIRMEAGDANGAFIGIGAGGLTVIGSGESTNAVRTALTNGADETMIVASDQTIRFLTGMQNGYSSAKEVSINAAGVINAPQGMTGNASTATKLQTARSINGTNFDGTGNITTANWGTARNIQIGNTSKSVNGSGNISWSLSEIGAAASNHTHGLVNLNSEAFSGGNDLNTYNSTKTWVARTLNSTTNKPGDYFTVVNFGANSNSNFQLAHSYGNSSTLYVRGRHDTSGNYTPWAKIYTDKNKPTASDIGAAPSSSTSLNTTDKTIVGAINEVFQSGNSVKQNLVDTLIAKGAEDISTSNSWDSLIDIIEGSNISLAPTGFTVENVSGSDYGFRLMDSGYYESENYGINNSYAMCKLNIVCNSNYNVYLDCINYAENSFDYGIISQINTPLTPSYQADTTGVLKSFKGQSSPEIQTVQLRSESGFYYIKYVKDSSASQGNDSLCFKVRFEKKTGGNPGVPGNPGGKETILFSSTIGGDNRSLTGGYTHKMHTSDSYFMHDASCMDFMAYSNGRSNNTLETVISNNKINLTNYSRLRIKGYFTTTTNDSGGAPLVGFDAVGNRDSAFAASIMITSSGQRYYDLDISNLTGNYHLKFNVATSLVRPSTGEIIKHLYITELILYP